MPREISPLHSFGSRSFIRVSKLFFERRRSGRVVSAFTREKIYGSHPYYATTLIPMFFAVPSIIGMTDSTLVALVSGSLVFAISSTCALVTCPTKSLLGLPEPEATPECENKSEFSANRYHAMWQAVLLTGCFLDQHRCRWGLEDEGEASILDNRQQ